MSDRAYYTVRELAKRLGFTRRTIVSWANRGKIEGAYRFPDDSGEWRFDRATFDRWEGERGAVCRSTGEEKPGGSVFSGGGKKLDDRLARLYGA